MTQEPQLLLPTWRRSPDQMAKVLPRQARGHNRILVYRTLAFSSALSRAEIARKTGLAPVTISELVAELMGIGLIIEAGQRNDSKPGKPATILEIDHDVFHVVSVDLSDANMFRSVILDIDGNVQAEHTLATGGATGEAAVLVALECTRLAIKSATRPIIGIGVGASGIIDSGGTVISAPLQQWTNFDLRSRMADEFLLPVHVANNASAAVMAESWFRNTASDVLFITIGAGVGAGLLLEGVPRLGKNYAAGEIGHITVGDSGGPPCVCGRTDCLETWLAVPALERALSQATTGPERMRVLRDAGHKLGLVVAPIVGALDVADVALSGPQEFLQGDLLSSLQDTLRQRTLGVSTAGLTVRVMEESQYLVARGCAALVIMAELGGVWQ